QRRSDYCLCAIHKRKNHQRLIGSPVALKFWTGASRNRRFRAGVLVAKRAVAAAVVNPILLDEIIARTQFHVRISAIRALVGRSKSPRAFVRVFLSSSVVPGIEVRVGSGFFQLVSDD